MKIILSKCIKILISSFLFFFVGALFANRANAAVVSCQKPADVVLSVDNSDSISSYVNPTDTSSTAEAERQEWNNFMDFVKSFANGFVVSPAYTHTSIVTFDGLSYGDINCYGKPAGTPGCFNGQAYPAHKMIPGYPTLPQEMKLGSQVYSDTIVGLTDDPNVLTNTNGNGAIEKLKVSRYQRLIPYSSPCGYAWYREPREYFPVKKFAPPNDYDSNVDKDYLGCGINGFKVGATDWGAGFNRAYDILKNSPRFNNPGVEKLIIHMSDGIPTDNDLAIQDTDPAYKYAKEAKDHGVKIFSIIINIDNTCGSSTTCRDKALAWTEAVASDPKPSYSFQVNKFSEFQGVVSTILNSVCGVEGLNVNGFLLTNNSIQTKRSINVNDYYSYLKNNYFDTILRGLSIGRHFISFD